jgi:hypothetical protein
MGAHKGTDTRLLTVQQCLQLAEPDTSWMTKPWPRSKFAGWLQPGIAADGLAQGTLFSSPEP